MTGKLPSKKISVAIGTASNLAKSDNHEMRISEFSDLFREPLVTPETFATYTNAGHQRKLQLKAANGWLFRCPVAGKVRNRKNTQPSIVLSFDLDDVSQSLVDSILAGEVFPNHAMIVHSTRGHYPESPRLRMFLFAEKNIPPVEYNRVSRIVGVNIDSKKEHIDPVSFRPAQMMFKPTVSRDMLKHYIFYEQPGDFLDTEELIDIWEEINGDSNDISNLPKWPTEATLRQPSEEAEDPLEKKGPVGDFCRAWSITDLVQGQRDEDGVFHEGPLKDKYVIDDWDSGAASRMTYLHGHSTNGAVVYGDKFVYSHHGTDPASDQLLNAYDLVRVHLFGSRDDEFDDEGKTMKDRPSVKAMAEYLKTNDPYRDAQVESRFAPEDAFSDDDVDPYEDDDEEDDDDDDLPSADDLLGHSPDLYVKDRNKAIEKRRRKRAAKPRKNWIRGLNLNDDGTIKNTLPNAAALVIFDPRLWRNIGYNEHRSEVCLLDDLNTKTPILPDISVKDKAYGDRWQDYMTTTVQAITELQSGIGPKGGYDIKFADNTIIKAVEIAAHQNAYNPIKDFFDDVRESHEPDVERLETFFIRHAGVEDNAYTREATMLMAIAAVARVEEPGCKFDHAIILEGAQGIGKSTLIKRLFGAQWFGEIGNNIDNPQRVAEAMQGVWAAEFAELATMNKSDVNDLKQFLTRQRDDVRMAYGRQVADLPRQTVFFGTTNDRTYLKDPTGNRRFWPFPCGSISIDAVKVMEDRDQFWATAHHLYQEMRTQNPEGDLPLVLSAEAQKIATRLQGERRKTELFEAWAETIEDWMDEEMKLRTLLDQDFKFDDGAFEHEGYNVDETIVQRVIFNVESAFKFGLKSNKSNAGNQLDQDNWGKIQDAFENGGWDVYRGDRKVRIAGKVRRGVLRPDATKEERRLGFRVIHTGAKPSTEPDSQVDYYRYDTTPDADDLL